MNKHYIYRHIRKDTDTPFYVGKGSGNRAYSSKKRNQYWHNIVNKYGYEIEIIIDNLTENAAYKKETEFIKLYKKCGYCEANMNLGGKGGLVPNTEIKHKIGKANKGRKHSNKSKQLIIEAAKKRKLSKESCKKISMSNKGRKWSNESKIKLSNSKGGTIPATVIKVVDIKTNKIFKSIQQASLEYNIKYHTLYRYLDGTLTNKTNLRYYIGE